MHLKKQFASDAIFIILTKAFFNLTLIIINSEYLLFIKLMFIPLEKISS